jgi:hypothetical protein
MTQIGDACLQRIQDASRNFVATAGQQHVVEAAERLDIGRSVQGVRCRLGARATASPRAATSPRSRVR